MANLYRNCISAKCDHFVCDVTVHVTTPYVTVYSKFMPQTLISLMSVAINKKQEVCGLVFISVLEGSDLCASLRALNTRIVIYKQYILDHSWMNEADVAYYFHL